MPQKKDNCPINVGDGAAIPHPTDKGLFTAWFFCLIAAISIILILYFGYPDPYKTIFHFLIPQGLIITFKVTIGGILLALFIGLIVGLGRISKWKPFYLLASTYVEVVRGIPLLVQLCYIYYAFSRLFSIPDLLAAILAMGICYGAYMGEVFRAGIESIDRGQREAALSLGYSETQTMWFVILPQALKTILPPIGNEFISLLKDSTLVSVVGVGDLMRLTDEYLSSSFDDIFKVYSLVALIYLVLTLLLSKIVSILETKFGAHATK